MKQQHRNMWLTIEIAELKGDTIKIQSIADHLKQLRTEMRLKFPDAWDEWSALPGNKMV